MSMETQNNTHFKEAGFGKRLLGYFLDLIFVVACSLTFYLTVGNKVLYKSWGGEASFNNISSFMTDSGLVSKTENGVINIDTYASSAASSEDVVIYNGYAQKTMAKVFNYYGTFLPSDSRSTKTLATDNGTITYSAQWFETSVLGFLDPSAVSDVTNEKQLSGTNNYFKYALNEAKTAVDPTQCPVFQDDVKSKIDAGNAEMLKNINGYLFDSSNKKGLYYNALVNLGYYGKTDTQANVQTYFTSNYAVYYKTFIGTYLISYLPFLFIFMFLIPLLSKHGETLGKWIAGTAVVRIDGYNIRPFERIVRPLCLFILGAFCAIPYMITLLGYFAFILIAIVDYMVLAMSKTHQSIHDKIARTIVIERKDAHFFKDYDEMMGYAKVNPSEMPEVHDAATEQANKQAAAEDAILDLSTINKNRDEAAKMKNFDEYEKSKAEENVTEVASTPKTQVNLTKDETPDEEVPMSEDEKKAMADLAALEGGTPEDKDEANKETNDAEQDGESKKE